MIGPWEIVLVVLVVVLLFGHRRIPKAGRAVGESARGFRDSLLRRHDGDAKAPLEEATYEPLATRKDEQV